MGEYITKEVLQFLNGGALPHAWNETVIVLIPKVPNPESLKDLRPINLCNVLCKIASKVLASRLKVISQKLFLRIKVHLFLGVSLLITFW